MNGWPRVDRFLRTDPRDVGCEEAMELLHVYVELVAARRPAQRTLPGIAAHLRACGPCSEDFEGLLAAITARRAERTPIDRPVHVRGASARGRKTGRLL